MDPLNNVQIFDNHTLNINIKVSDLKPFETPERSTESKNALGGKRSTERSTDQTEASSKNPLFQDTPCLSRDEVNASLMSLMKEARSKYKLRCTFELNYVTRYDQEMGVAKSAGYCHVFLTNPKVYHMLLGRNADGTERIKYIPDPDWVPEPESESIDEDLEFKPFDPTAPPCEMSWADMSESYFAESKKQEAPKIRVCEGPPLLSPLIHNTEKGDYQIPTEANFISLDKDSIEYDTDRLSSKVPFTVTDDILKSRFRIFSSDKAFPVVKSTRSRDEKKRVVIILFKPQSHDAMFARAIMFKTRFTVGNRTYDLKFDYPRSRERV